MGIKDLLKNLEGATVQRNIGDFSGKRLAIDASGWLHKAVFATAEDWVDSNCTDSQLYVDFMITRVRNVQACGVTPIMVFDGKRNNLKSETRAKRDEGRLGNIENAKRLIESISKTTDPGCRAKMRNECIACFQRGLGVTHEMEKNCMAALRKCNVDIIVAPYEADPQLAYLCHIGYCDGVMTEDSDILVYSAVCGTPFPILYKFEKSGSVQITDLQLCGVFASADSADEESRQRDISSTDLEALCNGGIGMTDGPSSTTTSSAASSASSKKRKLNKDPLAPPKMGSGSDGFLNQLQTYFKPARSSSSGGNDVNEVNVAGRRMFVQLCLLAGCDYSESVPGVGLQTAIQVVVRFKDVPNNLRLKKICDYFKLTGKRVADTYLPRILRAEQLFFYHPVFNPYSDSIAHFTPPLVTEAMESAGAIVQETLGPAISEVELFRLGADTAEILALSRRESPNGSPTNSQKRAQVKIEADPALLTIRSACRGHVSIKDGLEILPRYPWEGEASAQRTGNSSGWFMRRSLMQALGSAPSNSSSKPLSQFRAQSVGYNRNNYNNSSSSNNTTNNGTKSMNAISSFMLANVSTTRPSGNSSMFSLNRFAAKPPTNITKNINNNVHSGNTATNNNNNSNAVAPYHLQQQLSQVKTSVSKLGYFDSLELSGATQLSNANSPKITSHHFQRSVTAPVESSSSTQGISTYSAYSSAHFASESSLVASSFVSSAGESSSGSLSSSTDDEAFVYDLCEDSMSEIPGAASPPAKFARKSPIKASPKSAESPGGSGPTVYDILDSPVAVKNTIKVHNDGIHALDGDLSGEVNSPQLSFQEFLQSHKCDNKADTRDACPSKLEMLMSPACSATSTGPNAPTKKPCLQPRGTAGCSEEDEHAGQDADEEFARSLQSYALGGPQSPEAVCLDRASAISTAGGSSSSGSSSSSSSTVGPGQTNGMRRKTLGAAPFVPINLNSTSSSGDKRKIGYAAVPIARKKTTKSASAPTGSIMVASIKSFFSAVQ